MYFYKNGKSLRSCLDLSGDLVLSHNPEKVRGRFTSALPVTIKNGRFLHDIPRAGFWRKVGYTVTAVRFIWTARNLELVPNAKP